MMKKTLISILAIMLMVNLCAFSASAAVVQQAEVIALVDADKAPVAGETFYVSVYVDSIKNERFLSGEIFYSWPAQVAMPVDFYDETAIKDFSWAIGNVYEEFSGRTGKFSTVTNTDIEDGSGATALYINMNARDQDPSQVSGLKMYDIAFKLNNGYTFDDFYFTIEESTLFISDDPYVSYNSNSGSVGIKDIEKNSSSDFEEDEVVAVGLPTATVSSRLVGNKKPVEGEKFILAIDVNDISTSKFASGEVFFTWNNKVASLADYYEDNAVPVDDGLCIGNIYDEYLNRTGKFSSISDFETAGEGKVAIYINLSAKDQKASDVSDLTMFEIAFVLNEGYTYEDVDFEITDATLFIHEDKSISSDVASGAVTLKDNSSVKKVTVDSVTYTLIGANRFKGYDYLTNAYDGSELDWQNYTLNSALSNTATVYVGPVSNSSDAGVNGSDTMRTFFKVKGGKTYYVANSIYNLNSYSVELDAAALAVENVMFGQLAGLSAYNSDLYGGFTAWTAKNSAITMLDGDVTAENLTVAKGLNKVEYIITVPEDSEYIVLTYGAEGQGNVAYGDFEIYEADEKIHVTLDANGGECDVDHLEYENGEVYAALPIPTRVGHTFDGWYKDGVAISENDAVTEDHTLVANWTVNEYEIKLDSNGGTISINSMIVKYGDAYGTLPTPTRYGYDFNGWYKDGVMVSGTDIVTDAHTLIAKWSIKKYTVTFNANGGSCSVKNVVITHGSTYGTLPTPEREGYTFNGWYKSGVKVTSSSSVTSAHTLVANWTIIKYTVTFDANGGECDTSSKIYNYGSSYGELPVPEKIGYTFEGWYRDSVLVEGDEVIDATHTLVAKWKQIKYVVTFDANGGDCSVANMLVVFNAPYGELPVPERWCYNFLGWYDGDKLVSSDMEVTKNHTLKAEWEEVPNTIYVDNLEVYSGDTFVLPICVKDNPGIAGFKVTVTYGEGITPVSVKGGSIIKGGNLMSNNENEGSITIHWSNAANISEDGDLVLITFDSERFLNEVIDVNVTYEKGDITNQQYENLQLITKSGQVSLTPVMMGDVYEDKDVNTKDTVRLDQYLASWDIELSGYEERAADVYTDDVINMRDRLKLGKYLIGLENELFEVTEEGNIEFEVGTLCAGTDGYVDVPVFITENDGVSAFNLSVEFDKSLLTPVGIVEGEILGESGLVSNLQQEGEIKELDYVSAVWSNANCDITDTGLAFTVKFKVNSKNDGVIPVTLSYNTDDIIDSNYNSLNVTKIDGGVIVGEAEIYLMKYFWAVAYEDGTEVTVDAIKVKDYDKDVVLVVAAYEGDEMVDVATEIINPVTGKNFEKTVKLKCDGFAEIKAFVIDELGSIKSISNVIATE